ncbi:MAG: hypothetical protein FWB80_06780 [Defluviitaleaceae bacterium]|nr:hypothetical protein [Defluviitaleaceae bacterium]
MKNDTKLKKIEDAVMSSITNIFEDIQDDDTEFEHDKARAIERDELHLEMLSFVLESSKKVVDAIENSEANKTKWRTRLMYSLIGLLFISFVFICIMVVLHSRNIVQLSLGLIVGLFGTLVTQVVSLLVLFVRFVNDVHYLKMYKTITYKLLDYLPQSSTSAHETPSKKQNTI